MATRTAKYPSLTDRMIKQKIIRAKKTGVPVYGTFTIDPRAAARILALNTKNRIISEATVLSIAEDIKNGDWVSHSSQFIKFSEDGSLLDGQHRLSGIIKAGKAVPIEFAFGLSEKARIVTDTGRPRTFSDNISMDGVKYAASVSASTRILKQFLENPYFVGVKFKNMKVSSSNLGKVLAAHPKLLESVEATKSSLLKQHAIHSYSAFCHYVFSQTSHRARVQEFFEKMASGENMPADHPILAFRNRVRREGRYMRSQTQKESMIGMLFQTWNAFIRGDSVKRCFTPKTVPKVEGLRSINGQNIYRNAPTEVDEAQAA